MKGSSRKKRGRKSSMKRTNKKDMKSPLTITLIVLTLFIILIIFSIFNGPVQKIEKINPEQISDELPQDIINVIEESKKISSVNVNKAVAAENIELCEGNLGCENSFYYNTAKEPSDCDKINQESLRNNCRDNKIISKVLMNGDKSLCNQILNSNTKSKCEELKI